jgi:ribosomal-protein-alanine N-acetyltransferase
MGVDSPMPTLRLATDLPSVVLRRWAAGDKPALIAQANDRAVWRNLTETFPHPYTAEDAERWIAFANQPSAGSHLCIEVEGVAAGGIGIIAGEGVAQRTGRLGYWLGQGYWGRGIGTAAARTMLAYARASLPFARLEATVFEWNPASMRVLEKIGFVREGVLRRSVYKDGCLIGSVLYAHVDA